MMISMVPTITRSTRRVQTFAWRVHLESRSLLDGHSVERKYLRLAAFAAMFKKSTVKENHISSIRTRKLFWAGASHAGAWQSLLSTDDFQIVMGTCFILPGPKPSDTTLVQCFRCQLASTY